MAPPPRTTNAALADELLEHSERFNYFQVIRLLRRFGAESSGGVPVRVRTRPQLSLSFPETDVAAVERRGGGYLVTATFYGLYGVASPLPTFYTEDLTDEERDGKQASREFLDIVHYALYPQLFEAWRKYRLHHRVVEDQDRHVLDLLFALVGLEQANTRAALPYAGHLLRYLGLFSQRPRSVLGLQTILADAFEPAVVAIDSCVPRWIPIPTSQTLQLGRQGHALGETTYLGTQVEDASGQIRITLSDVPVEMFHRLLPGQPCYDRLLFLTRFYLTVPLQVEVLIRPRRAEIKRARLGGDSWSRAGLDTWLVDADVPIQSDVTYRLGPIIDTHKESHHAVG